MDRSFSTFNVDTDQAIQNGLQAASDSDIPILEQAAKALKLVSGLVGGVDQSRFFDRYDQIKGALRVAGYPVSGPAWDEMLTRFRIRKTQIDDKKSTGTYAKEFERLRLWSIAVLNKYNTGLGDFYNAVWSAWVMANKGNVKNNQIDYLTMLIKKYPPATYTGQEPMPSKVVPEKYSDSPDLTKSKLAAGTNTPEISEAGFGNMTILVVVILIVLGTWFYNSK